jgi:hypothetical protein
MTHRPYGIPRRRQLAELRHVPIERYTRDRWLIVEHVLLSLALAGLVVLCAVHLWRHLVTT